MLIDIIFIIHSSAAKNKSIYECKIMKRMFILKYVRGAALLYSACV